MMRLGLAACALLCFGAFVACGGPHTDDNELDEKDATLVVSPAASEFTLLNGVTATQGYTAALTWPDGTTVDVTSEVAFSVDNGVGSFAGSTLTLFAAGKGTVFATRDDKVGTAQVIVRVKAVRVEPPLDPATPDLFGAPEDVARAPTVVYPPADVVMPRNVGDFETHWTDGHGNDIFEVSLINEFVDVRVYVAGNNGDPAAGPTPSWTAFKASEWTTAVGSAQSIQYRVRGVQSSAPTSVGAAPPRLVKLSNENMEGGLYYWGNKPDGVGTYGIFRHDMAKAGQSAEPFMTTAQTGGRCVACHTLSRDGTKMAITYDGGNRPATLVDVATAVAQPEQTTWNFAAMTRDGGKLLTVFDGVLTVRDGATQAALATMTAASRVSHPDLSPDGTRLVYVRVPGTHSDWAFLDGALYTRTFDPITNAFGPETVLLDDANNNFYPSWSPDGQWIMFNRAVPVGDAGTDDAYDNANASLWVIKADGSQPPVELVVANQAVGLTNSWGRWAPFSQSVGGNNESIYWVTVSSKRDFGVRMLNRRPQIWMAPFYPSRAGTSEPSAPAFRLPFQNLETNNHIAQWTERIVAPQ